MTAWELAEYEHDAHREQLRTARLAKRETRFWPPVAGLLILSGFALAGLIENGWIQ